MKNLMQGFLLKRDKHTESLKPMLISTLARAVFFPDGKTLVEKWNEEIKSSIRIVHTKEVKELDGSTYGWSCTTFGDEKYILSGHYRPSIAYDPVAIQGEGGSGGSLVLIKNNEVTGETYEDVIPYGVNAGIEQYRFVIPMPIKFLDGRTTLFNNASINITEGHESSFLTMNTFHNIYAEYNSGNLFIYVNHFKGLDAIDLSNLPYITGDFNVTINGLFN